MSTFSTTILSGLILYDSLPCLRDDQSQLECQSQFMEPNISQGSMATYATCGEILSNHFTANLLEKKWKLVKILQNYGHEFGVQFFGLPSVAVLGMG